MSTVFFMVSVIPALACAHAGKGNVVDVWIVSDNGQEFAKYRIYPRVRQEGNFFYIEAVKGDRYSIQVTNKSGRRIGVVIAVDEALSINVGQSFVQLTLKGPCPRGPFKAGRIQGV